MIDLRGIRRVRANRHADAPTPLSVNVNVTGRCPCRCWHCEKAVQRDGRDMAWESLVPWLELAGSRDCPVLYSGGEPMVHARWADILAEGRRRGLAQSVVTSGIALSRLSAQDGADLVAGLEEILISRDAADPGEHDRLRGVPGLGAGIDRFLEEFHGADNVWLVHVPPPDFSGVEDMIDLAARHRVGLIVQPYIFKTNYPGIRPLGDKAGIEASLPGLAPATAERARTLARRARDAGTRSNLDEIAAMVGPYYARSGNGSWFGHDVLPRFVCSVPWQQVTVDERGRLQPCVFLPGPASDPADDPAARWQRQARKFRAEQLAGRTWPECRACSCHFGINFRNSLLMFPWRNRRNLGALLRARLTRALRTRNPRGERRGD